ncbi:MAG: hypothetical protein WKH64_18190 [Chloroflexia bacterium]
MPGMLSTNSSSAEPESRMPSVGPSAASPIGRVLGSTCLRTIAPLGTPRPRGAHVVLAKHGQHRRP